MRTLLTIATVIFVLVVIASVPSGWLAVGLLVLFIAYVIMVEG